MYRWHMVPILFADSIPKFTSYTFATALAKSWTSAEFSGARVLILACLDVAYLFLIVWKRKYRNQWRKRGKHKNQWYRYSVKNQLLKKVGYEFTGRHKVWMISTFPTPYSTTEWLTMCFVSPRFTMTTFFARCCITTRRDSSVYDR